MITATRFAIIFAQFFLHSFFCTVFFCMAGLMVWGGFPHQLGSEIRNGTVFFFAQFLFVQFFFARLKCCLGRVFLTRITAIRFAISFAIFFAQCLVCTFFLHG